MNDLLEFTGALLYFVLSIVLFPLFILVQLLLWSVSAFKHLQLGYNRLAKIKFKKSYHLPHFLDPIFERFVRKHM